MADPFYPDRPVTGVTKFSELYAILISQMLAIWNRGYGTSNPPNLVQGVKFIKEVGGVPIEYFFDGSQIREGINLHPEIVNSRGTAASLAARLLIALEPDGSPRNTFPAGGAWWLPRTGAAYSTSTSFTIAGDLTALFVDGRALYFTTTGGVITYSYVASSEYDGATYTTVNTTSPDVPDPITLLYYGQEVANAPLTSNWWTSAISPTRTASQTFTVSGDKTANFKTNTSLRYETTSGVYSYDYVTSSSYAAGTGLTTVTVQSSVPTVFVAIAYGQDPANAPFIGGLSLPAPIMTGLAVSDTEGDTQTLTITNYDAANTYNIAVSGGSAIRTDDEIVWTLPAVTADTIHTITVYASKTGYTNSYSAVQSISVLQFPCPTPTLTGNSTISEGSSYSGTITNYDAEYTYTWSASPTISGLGNSGSTWSFTAPAVDADTEYTISVYATHSVYGQSTTTTKAITVENIPISPGADIVFTMSTVGFPDGIFV